MTTPNVPPVDPNIPAQVDPVDPVDPENDEDLDPAVDPAPPQDETPEQLKARLAESQAARERLWARLQREKNKGKPASPAPSAPASTPAPAATPGLTREEGILFARGLSEEEVEQAKKVAALQGVKLTDAVNDDLFTGWKAKRDKDAKDKAAQLGVSRGARPASKKTLATSGLSDAEHRELFNEKVGK